MCLIVFSTTHRYLYAVPNDVCTTNHDCLDKQIVILCTQNHVLHRHHDVYTNVIVRHTINRDCYINIMICCTHI